MSARIMTEKRGSSTKLYEEIMELRRGPWTLEEDSLLIHYIARHGEGRWNLLARCSGLRRTGKSCRLRWLNYLKPDIKRGNLSPEEQLLILELHSKWGNRWSRIAQHLPGRTDNEIKNYWRTRVQKQARQLKVDANSTVFRDAVRCHWMPRLLEKTGSSPPTVQSLEYVNNTNTYDQLHQIPCPDQLSSTNPSMQYYELESSTSNHSPSTSSCSAVLPQLIPVNMYSEFPPVPAELDGVAFDPLFSSGCSMNNAYNLDTTWDIAPMSASAPGPIGHSASSDYAVANNNCSSNNVGDGGLWSMDELYDLFKSYVSGAESKVPFGDDNS